MALIAATAVFFAVLLLGLGGRSSHPSFLSTPEKMNPTPKPAASSLGGRLERVLHLSGVRLGARQVIIAMSVVSLAILVAIYRAVGSLPVALVLSSMGIAYPYLLLTQFERKRRDTLGVQFKEALNSIAYSLKAGASLQRSFERAVVDLRRVFPGGTAPIIQELEEIVRQLHLGSPVETVLTEWAERVQLEEVSDFVAATVAVKTRGGNLAEVMAVISSAINWKIEANAQIRAITAEKRSEANLLTAMPSVVLALLWLLSRHYLEPLFQPGLGQGLLLVGIVLNIAAFFAVRKVLTSPV